MSAVAETRIQEGTAVVVFGLDGAGKPHASTFNQDEAHLAEKAAELMGMHLIRPDSDEQHALAAQLPRGRVFASGKAFVPFVRAGLYEALTALAGVSATSPAPRVKSAPVASPSPPEGTSKADLAPGTWADIDVGNVVLALEGPGEGWWEAVVLKADPDLFTLRWRDWPDLPVFARRSWQLALLPPGRRA